MKFLKTKENVVLHYCVLSVVFGYVLYNSWSGFTGIVGTINFAVMFAYFLVRLLDKNDEAVKKYGVFFSIIMFIVLFLNLGSIAVTFMAYDNLMLYLCRLLDCLFKTCFVFYICIKTLPEVHVIKEESNKVITFILGIASIAVTVCVSVPCIVYQTDVDMLFLIMECILTLLLRLLSVRYFSLVK